MTWYDWLNLIVRWFHFVAGIAWIGSSFYFMWLDANLEEPKPARPDVEGELWMVHSGGFYRVERRLIGPGRMPAVLHWFKWEAAFTLLTGLALLGIVYYANAALYMVDPRVSGLSPVAAVGVGIGTLIASWFAYDALWMSPLSKRPGIATAISCVGAVVISIALCKLFSGRAAYMHVGAMMGTIMVVNVWVRILPGQQRMIDATAAGREPDYEHGKRAKRRSVHNSYMTLPVLFIMLSNHFPGTYGHELNWFVLWLIVVGGALVRHLMIIGWPKGAWTLLPAAACLGGAMYMTVLRTPASAAAATEDDVPFSAVQAIVTSRCVVCHSHTPADTTFGVMPGGVSFDEPENIVKLAERINFRAVVTKTMPLANQTGMTDAERATLGQWIAKGAKGP
jgi:uncharacterized membrane protein